MEAAIQHQIPRPAIEELARALAANTATQMVLSTKIEDMTRRLDSIERKMP
jgi:hypothetical protein